MTEANDYTGGVDGASNAFVSALWALDYLHWHAARGAAGVNFHNKSWIFTDTIYRSGDGTFHFNPKAYAFKAFEVGGQGRANPVSINNDEDINLTAYAVRANHEIYVTLINKEHGPQARTASVALHAAGLKGEVEGMSLEAPGANLTAREGITFGGAAITPSGWDGHWSKLAQCRDDRTTVLVHPASALVVKLANK